MRFILGVFFGAFALSLIAGAPAAAQGEPQFVAEYRDWRVYTRDVDGDRICFALSRPEESSPRNVDHGEVYFLVSSWRSGAASDQPSVLVGYDLRPESPPEVRVGSSRYDMFSDGREGFMDDLDDEGGLIRAMRRGSAMRVTATSARGTATAYRFSLLGVSAALDRVSQLCG